MTTNIHTTMMNYVNYIASGDDTDSRLASRLYSHMYRYREATKAAATFAASVRDAMNRIDYNLRAGKRVFDSDVTTWHARLAEEITKRQQAADAITELTFMLDFTSEQSDALWEEIEEGVANALL